MFIPDKDDVLLNRKAGSVGLTGRRIEALTRLIQNKAEIAVIPAEALLQYYPNVDAFRAAHVTLMKEEEYAPEKVANKLVSMGYTRVESMSDRGEFSLRGDILDVYPLASEYPIRISYFDDLVESIKYFRPETMESVKEVGHVTLSPATDVLI